MNQKELIEAIASNAGVSKASIKWMLEVLADAVHKEIKSGGEITLPGIGKLSVSHRAARAGRNPKTGATLHIEAKKTPKFTAAKALKDAVA